MITLEAHYVYLLIVSNAIMLALACFCFTRFENRCKQIEEFWSSPTGSAVADNDSDDTHAQMRMTQRLEKRVGELQRTVKVMEIEKANVSSAPPVERNLPIENAVRMARLGATIDDLTKNCGLNIGEARLMQKLHGKTRLAAGNA
ncbi:MAG: DUF2802 domain-containing protein [Gammaproteobacteria bacterium]|nr:DUF2802 domain-containing protein [Gammaproteobacteria bacterium]